MGQDRVQLRRALQPLRNKPRSAGNSAFLSCRRH